MHLSIVLHSRYAGFHWSQDRIGQQDLGRIHHSVQTIVREDYRKYQDAPMEYRAGFLSDQSKVRCCLLTGDRLMCL